MKQKITKLTSLLVLLCVLFSGMAAASCGLTANPTDTDGIVQATEKTDSTEEPDDSDTAPGIAEDTDTITREDTDSIACAAASGLQSSVSIYCTFETTYGGTSPWDPMPTTQTYYTAGSGVIYRLEDDGSAFIVTNHHVVYDSDSDTENRVSDKIYVYLYGMEDEAHAIPATYVGGSANYDIAVLRVDQSEIRKNAAEMGAAAAVTVADSDEVVPGMTAIAIGNPSASDTDLGGISVTRGIVSVDSEYITMTASDDSSKVTFRVIRTDAPVNSGNSGGGLFNDEGELIGIVNAKISGSSVEVSACSAEYDIETGLLIRCEEIRVCEVTPGSLGEDIFKEGDIIKSVTIGDRTVTVTRQHHLTDAMLDVRAGDTVSIVIVRDGVEQTVTAAITEDCLAAY